ncbi:MAG: DUF364 domain-containing protein [Gammaproteobacteria bacterium]|jgi:uncharacterized protein (DUF4213/DUF364 family)|nr:DUF364 domain-containing protein [Gammaproteobacteria bacterium]MDX2458902.1 DUF364 domain-containing protein [Gammaproteobacteria bacterium]
MSIANDYLDLIHRIGGILDVPPVRSIHIAPFEADPEKSSKFGAMILTDGTVGLTYTALDGALSDLQDRSKTDSLINTSPVQIAQLYAGEFGWQRSLGMAAINAVSQFVFEHSGYVLPAMDKTLDLLALEKGDHVGMVGYFPPLVEQVRARGVPLTVVELNEKWIQRTDGLEVTLDLAHLNSCNKVVCTGTVLINQTLDSVLEHCGNAEQILIVGPTTGCLPDPLFDRGVTLLGGSVVVDHRKFLQLWAAQEKWRRTARRYVLRRGEGFPGYQALLAP